MAVLKAALFGLADSGKTSLFSLLTGQEIPLEVTSPHGGKPKPHLGTAGVADDRLGRLQALLKPTKVTPVFLGLVDFPMSLSPESKMEIIDHLREADVILLVVRSFRQETVSHPLGGVDSARDLRLLGQELLAADLAVLGNRRDKLKSEVAKGLKGREKEETLLTRLVQILEAERPLRAENFSSEELKLLSGFQSLTLKPVVVLLNLGEAEFPLEVSAPITQWVETWQAGLVPLAVRTELELKILSPEEAASMAEALGIKLTQGQGLLTACLQAMRLIRFYTTVGDEVRAWPLRQGSNAWEAAAKIHTDMARGFIRAEVVDFDTFCAHRASWTEARAKGVVRLEGKEYVVQDGDLLHFRFSP
jgi:GTP-binding protein YchF